jgi:2-hydroxychromene-2-carboxylate isomerase
MTTTATPSASLEIEFWFEFGSNYSYLSVMRIEEEAHRLSVRIAWKPFLLGPIFRALGMENSPFVLQKEKGAYMLQDMARMCWKYGLAPWVKPSVFPRRCSPPADRAAARRAAVGRRLLPQSDGAQFRA